MANSTSGTRYSAELVRNVEIIHNKMGSSSDFVVRNIKIAHTVPATLFYLDGMVNLQTLQNSVIAPLVNSVQAAPITLRNIQFELLETGNAQRVSEIEAGLQKMLSGAVLLLIDQSDEALSISLPEWQDRAIEPSSTQPAVRGPQYSFIETLRTNTTLVRRIVKDTRVRIVSIPVGTMTKTEVALMYIDGLADPSLVQNLQRQLETIDADRVLEGEYLEEMLLESKIPTIFPLMHNTDRPDTIAAGILEGRVALFVDGTPFVLLAPSYFVDFLQSAEDYYQSYIYSTFIRILRYVSLCICMLAPAVYIALTTFHQDMLPTQLLLSLATQREGIPFPAFVEALMMEVTFEILREAGLRMPRTIGQAVSIVGTIVIGQAAVEASIVSAVMVIVVAITAISSFVIPAYSMSIAIRMLRFVFMVLAATMGFYGITMGLLLLTIHLCWLRTFGTFYMNPIAPYNKKEQRDAIRRAVFRK